MTPTTVNGTLSMKTDWPTGSSVPKRSVARTSPMKQTRLRFGHVLGVDEPALVGDGVAHQLELGIDAADGVAELLAAVADDAAADELRADDLDARDLLRDGLDHLGGDPHGLALEEPLPGEGRPRGEDEDDALAHAVEALDLGLAHGIAEGDEQDDRERAPDDARQGQGGPQRLADEVPEEVAEEDRDHLISRGGRSTTLSPSLTPSRISMFSPSERPVWTSTFFVVLAVGDLDELLAVLEEDEPLGE